MTIIIFRKIQSGFSNSIKIINAGPSVISRVMMVDILKWQQHLKGTDTHAIKDFAVLARASAAHIHIYPLSK
jgi:hypothetical protein